jgi:hypothetical protein
VAFPSTNQLPLQTYWPSWAAPWVGSMWLGWLKPTVDRWHIYHDISMNPTV